MSDEAAAPAASEGASAPEAPSAASAILARKKAETAKPTETPVAASTEAPAESTETPPAVDAQPAPKPGEDRAEYNKRLIAEERAKRQAKREREEAEKAKREAAEEREAAKREREEAAKYRSDKESWEQAIADAKRDPIAFLDRTGLSIDDLVRAKLGNEVSPELLIKDAHERTAAETKQLREEIEALKAERKKEREEAEARTRAERAEYASRTIKKQIDETLTANPTKYPLITKLGEQDEIYKLIEGRFIQSKGEIVLSPEEAADEVEKYHRGRLQLAGETSALDELIDALPTEKKQALIARLTAAASTAAAPDPKAQPGKAAPQAKTTPDARAKTASALTANTVTSPATPAEAPQPLEDREAFIARKKAELREAKKAAASTR
jgi:hypothetical protein